MNINHKLLESSDITTHFMTKKEIKVRRALCKLLIDKKHVKYAERLYKLQLNIVDAAQHPDFTAAISFDDATVYVSSGFLSGESMFAQLDVLMRHELAHNLMMHQIRLMHTFQEIHKNDPDNAWTHIKYSATLHNLLNIIEDFEISNKRYTSADKNIVRAMILNGNVISGLVTEDHRKNWQSMSVEEMYKALSNEIDSINNKIRTDPNWQPVKDTNRNEVDIIKLGTAKAVAAYQGDLFKKSEFGISLPEFMKSNLYKKLNPVFTDTIKIIADEIAPVAAKDPEAVIQIIKDIGHTSVTQAIQLTHPITGVTLCTLYTPEDKWVAVEALKCVIHDYLLGIVIAKKAAGAGILDAKMLQDIIDVVEASRGKKNMNEIVADAVAKATAKAKETK